MKKEVVTQLKMKLSGLLKACLRLVIMLIVAGAMLMIADAIQTKYYREALEESLNKMYAPQTVSSNVLYRHRLSRNDSAHMSDSHSAIGARN